MSTQKRVTTEDLIFKLSEVLFSTESEQFIQVINKFEANANFNLGCTMEEYRKMTDAEQTAIFAKIEQDAKGKNKEGKIEFTLDGERYELRHNTQDNRIYLSHYKTEPVFEIQDILKNKVSKDIDIFKKDLTKISELCDLNQFVTTRVDRLDPFYNNIIASRTFQSVSIYLSDETLKVMVKLKSLFTPEEQATIELLVTTKFAIHTQRFDDELIKFFVKWIPKLRDGSYTEAKQLEFNDLDNHAYCVNNEKRLMIVQESQNTIFAYVFNKENSQIKVWNCAQIFSGNLDYEMNHYETYLELMKEMGNPYSYYNFPIEMKGVSYPKSANYYMDNFEDESEFLVFDSFKGFRVNTYFSDCMATDVPLLLSVVAYLDKENEEDEEEVDD
jgi:hypothetical protein